MNLSLHATLTYLLILFSTFTLAKASPALEDNYRFAIERRVNAHGDEFMSIGLMPDRKRLVIATESGKIIVWGIPERRILKELNQGSPVHCVLTSNDPDTFVAAGGPHTGQSQRGVIRRWNITSGKSEDWQGPMGSTFLSLTGDSTSGLTAASNATGELVVWDEGGKVISTRQLEGMALGLALRGREVYVSTASGDPNAEEPEPNSLVRFSIDKPNAPPIEVIAKNEDKVWFEFKMSPDGCFLAARCEGGPDDGVVLIESGSGKQIEQFKARGASWAANGLLVLFDSEVATDRIRIDERGQISRTGLLKAGTWHQAGSPSHMTGQVVSKDGAMAWQVFQLGAALVESDLEKKSFDDVYYLRGYAYAMHVRESVGLIATGGDDEFVRVRKLSDLSLIKEYRVSPGVPQGVALMDDGRHVVFSASARDTPSRISVGDLSSGETRVLFETPEPFVQVVPPAGGFIFNRGNKLILASWETGASIREFSVEPKLEQFAVSANGQWLVTADDQGKLRLFAIGSGKQIFVGKERIDNLTRLIISDDGRFIYTTEFHADLKKWDTRSNSMRDLASIRGQARTLLLSTDGKRIVVGGNHRDVAVYDTSTGEALTSFSIAAADFYVTNVWLSGERLLFTTDAGVLFDGWLKQVEE